MALPVSSIFKPNSGQLKRPTVALTEPHKDGMSDEA